MASNPEEHRVGEPVVEQSREVGVEMTIDIAVEIQWWTSLQTSRLTAKTCDDDRGGPAERHESAEKGKDEQRGEPRECNWQDKDWKEEK